MDEYNYLGEKFIETKANNVLYFSFIVLNIILIIVLTILLFIYKAEPNVFINQRDLSYVYLISLMILCAIALFFSIFSIERKIEIYSNGFTVVSLFRKKIILYDNIKSYKLKYIPFSYWFNLKIYLKDKTKLSLHEANYDDLKILLYKIVDRVI
ncbi:MAG: hypothetical protein FWC47_02480 [Oscillospiraceae bacterium]|nr:hypothetical protein [Oscillospiraceae bacterium]